MKKDDDILTFLSGYPAPVAVRAQQLRQLLLELLPGVTEQPDMPARMIAYCYGQTYAALVCTIIPSQKGVKLGFYKGISLPDPQGILKGAGKISRYVDITDDHIIADPSLAAMIRAALAACRERLQP
ncbi:DUF1801 domain-containing protein [Chitinophaga solisilvae]|uniref:YdhG-like domain-containing protein n=1 Tax=Chitinophaga solisilvae TaxID=1233460 RepID=A0A433WHU3_9BACT|nr:DUF1801 domain-containing protein [Chitinophaga solisilvae]NSL87645.1 hypothetical protein [Chitinophaga solisilvae]